MFTWLAGRANPNAIIPPVPGGGVTEGVLVKTDGGFIPWKTGWKGVGVAVNRPPSPVNKSEIGIGVFPFRSVVKVEQAERRRKNTNNDASRSLRIALLYPNRAVLFRALFLPV
jgi:hypothetical protein